MTKRIRPPDTADVTLFMRMLFLRTERDIVNEIRRKRGAGLVDYAEAAALERVQAILQNMVDESWAYVPVMIEKIFYHSDKDAAGYANARALTVTQLTVVEQLSNNLLGEITEAASVAEKSVQDFFTIARLENDPFRQTALKQVLMQQAQGKPWIQASTEAASVAEKSVQDFFTIARLENDPFRQTALKQVLMQQAQGKPWIQASQQMVREMENQGIPAFVDKAGRTWSLQSYGNMAVRTTARQAQVAALLTADDHDLWQIVKIGSTCPVCAALEGRIYSKSGTNPDYPPLTLAFGKVDPSGSDDLTNTYLNIHPNCLHSLIKYTTIGKTEKQIQKDKDFSNPEKNPLNRDPRTKKQIAAYREKERNRRRLLADMRQHKQIQKDKDFSNPEKNPLNRDPRTKKQIAAYREKERNRRRLLADMRQHKEYRSVLGDDVPKDFAKFQEMKYNKSETFSFVELDYRRRNRLLYHPELKLPNAENVIAPDRKFTHYLFAGDFQEGLAKGRAFKSRLGYDESNWKELKREIILRAPLYPACYLNNNGYGNRYEQKIILYGKNGRPANVVVGWLCKPDGSTSMSSVYIKEVK